MRKKQSTSQRQKCLKPVPVTEVDIAKLSFTVRKLTPALWIAHNKESKGCSHMSMREREMFALLEENSA